jgi:hypothetical protein
VGIGILSGCGGASKKATEVRYVALANSLCRETQKPGFDARRPSSIRREQEEAHALVGVARTSRRAASYLTDLESQEGDDTYQLRAKTYADKKALGLTACLGPPPRNPKCGTRKPGRSGVLTLLPADVRRTLRVLRKSDALAHLLHGVGYRLAHKGPWSGGEENCLVGAILWLTLAHPIEMVAMVPEAVYEPNVFPPYIAKKRFIRAPAVTGLVVQVDFVHGVVADVRAQSLCRHRAGLQQVCP